MAAVINIDTSQFRGEFEEIINLLRNTELWLRPITAELSGEMANRIHNDGLASDGSKIGGYASNYLQTRARYKLGADTKVILVLTRKMSNSWGVFATEKGWAVGFVDDSGEGGVSSLDKLRFNEERFGKKIGDLTEDETRFVNERINEILNDLLSQYGRA